MPHLVFDGMFFIKFLEKVTVFYALLDLERSRRHLCPEFGGSQQYIHVYVRDINYSIHRATLIICTNKKGEVFFFSLDNIIL